MSLLLDALKKAEQSKRDKALRESGQLPEPVVAAQVVVAPAPVLVVEPLPALELTLDDTADRHPSIETVSAPSTAASLEPTLTMSPLTAEAEVPAPVVLEAPLPSLITTPILETPMPVMESVAPPPVVERVPPPPEPPPAVLASAQVPPGPVAAQRIMQAQRPPRQSRRPVYLLIVVIVVAVAIFAANWWFGRPAAVSRPVHYAPPQASALLASPASTVPAGAGSASAARAMPARAARNVRPAIHPRRRVRASHPVLSIAQTPVSVAAPPLASGAAANPVPASAPSVPQVVRVTPAAHIAPGVAAGYQSYLHGDYAAAERSYSSTLSDEPNNRDALLGLAAALRAQGRYGEAATAYRRLLLAYPQNADATAGLAAIQSRSDPDAGTAALKTMSDGGSAQAMFELGNVQARVGNWREAQSQYFNALAADPGQPDYAYNLAVSLDHLNQPALARTYYQQAKHLASQRPARFDPAALERRLAELGGKQ